MFNLKQIREKVILTSGYMYNTVDYIDVQSFEYFLMFYNEKNVIKYMLLHVESQNLTVKLTGMIVST